MEMKVINIPDNLKHLPEELIFEICLDDYIQDLFFNVHNSCFAGRLEQAQEKATELKNLISICKSECKENFVINFAKMITEELPKRYNVTLII